MNNTLSQTQPNLSQIYQDPALTSAQSESQAAQNQAAVYLSASALLPQKLKQAIQEKMDYNSDIISQKNAAMSAYFQAPSAARAKYSDPSSEHHIWNPFQQEALVSRERAQAYEPYANLVDILGQRQGSLADIIQAGTEAFQSDVLSKQSAAELARSKYEDILGLTDRKADVLYKLMQLSKSGSGGGSVGEREQAAALLRLKKDVASGTTFKDAVLRYSDTLPASVIRSTYNESSPYGQAKEDEATVQDWFNTPEKPTANRLTEIRQEVVQDIVAGASQGVDRNNLRQQLGAAYPELDANELDALLNSFYPKTETSTSSVNLNDWFNKNKFWLSSGQLK